MYVESPFQFRPTPKLLGCNSSIHAKPFLKWVGGKTQLIDQLDANVPIALKDGSLDSYFEPFVGGGAFFFHVAQKYKLRRLVLADSNEDLILAYWTIRDNLETLVQILQELQAKYLLLSEAEREAYYYETRTRFNEDKVDMARFSDDWIERSAQLIFLNKTCFNGLFRVNASGLFNVAFGKYTNPKICDPDNLKAVSTILGSSEILLGDFTCVLDRLDSKSFVYLDPPYRPLTSTANFTGYSSSTFTDADQERLARFCRDADKLGAKLMISNSDPDNVSSTDTFFQDTYPGYNIIRAFANRMVNCKADKRGKISELIIMNYSNEVAAKPSTPKAAAKTATTETLAKASTAEPNKRSSAALGAFELMQDCAKKDKSFDLDDLQKATGWKPQTGKTYLSKKWKDYIEPAPDAKSSYIVKKSFLSLSAESFLQEFSQVLAPKKPSTVEEARDQAKSAMLVYAELLAQANNVIIEKKIRDLLEQL